MSYKVLLADDERLDLEGMRTFIPWQDLGMEVVDAVTNGFNARTVLTSEKIDILVTDVRMPHMSGLELAELALNEKKDLKVIFVSGYQDFHYAKQALSLNACGYVLKPMDDQELIDSLIKARDLLDMERKRQAEYSQMIPVVKNEYMLQLFEGSYTESTIDVLRREYNFKQFAWPGRVCVLEIDDLFKMEGKTEESRGKSSTWLDGLLAWSREAGIAHGCKVDKNRVALLLQPHTGHAVIERLVDQVKSEFGTTVTAGIGGNCSEVNDIERSYRQALEAVELKMFRGKGKLIEFEDVPKSEMEDIKRFDVRMDALFKALSSYELVRIHDELDALFQTAKNAKSKFTVRNYAFYLLLKLDDYLHTVNEDLFELLNMDMRSLDIILQLETIDDIHLWLRQRLYQISELLNSKRQKKNWKLISEIISFIRDRIQDNITLRDVAEQFSFSPNYLGLLFKEETGKNFSEYLIMLRMERACELLKNTNLKIYEIADQVGYRYLPYFSRQFKETYGKTPLEYRRK
ncbi:response regulator [Paenibacillus methanolicus]|uniref:Two-component system response regulator YesN n=1 Tax=Paenibacillus methanolicus TaxID=582686 RepID=A0A5S5CIM9_9BACL|nr:response regulator [Paenibacillus methanolicus]TYP79646.1 two-component system response regulator YesN [Paenibacillus methanolicus]